MVKKWKDSRYIINIVVKNMKYDVGIVGYWYATDYGSALTYYALNKAISNLGFSTVLIDRPEKEKDPEGEDVFSRNFLKKHCAISESVPKNKLNTLSDLCDSFIVGSDLVWNRKAIWNFEYMFFLSFAGDNKRKIAYAPSFGSLPLNVLPETIDKMGYYLHRFEQISVREDSGKELLKKEFDIDVPRTISPLFLLGKEDYRNIADESEMIIDEEEKYLLAYVLNPDEDKEQSIKAIAKKLNLKVKIVLDGRKGTFEKNKAKFKNYNEEILQGVNEEDWVKLLGNADYVFTDSPHGCIMSAIFNKDFVCYANYQRGYEYLVSVLQDAGLSDRLIQNSGEVMRIIENNPINYVAVESKLNDSINTSVLWLKSSLATPVVSKSKEYYSLKYEIDMLRRSINRLYNNLR